LQPSQPGILKIQGNQIFLGNSPLEHGPTGNSQIVWEAKEAKRNSFLRKIVFYEKRKTQNGKIAFKGKTNDTER
jgi:hypothetical protein